MEGIVLEELKMVIFLTVLRWLDSSEPGSIDYHTALALLKKFASDGYAPALTEIGTLHVQGFEGSINYEEALRCYKLAADQGYPGAQYNLALSYLRGTGVSPDTEMALKLLQMAAEQGFEPAIEVLSNNFEAETPNELVN